MNCLFCGIEHNDTWISSNVQWYFFSCGNAYDKKINFWIDSCSSEMRWPQ